MSRAICRYMLFTPMDGTPEESAWLPKIPPIKSKKSQEGDDGALLLVGQHAKDCTGVEMSPLGIVNGHDKLFASLELSAQLSNATPEQIKKKLAYDATLPDLLSMEFKALSQQCARMELQRIGDDDAEAEVIIKHSAFKADIQH
jgi:hypothetical protein